MSALHHSSYQRKKKHNWQSAIRIVHEARLVCKEKGRPKTCESGSYRAAMPVFTSTKSASYTTRRNNIYDPTTICMQCFQALLGKYNKILSLSRERSCSCDCFKLHTCNKRASEVPFLPCLLAHKPQLPCKAKISACYCQDEWFILQRRGQ